MTISKETIISDSNKNIKLVKSLHSSKGRKKSNLILLEGHRFIYDALKNGVIIDSIYITESYEDSLDFKKLLKEINVNTKIYIVTELIMNKITTTVNNQGIIAVARKLKVVEDFNKFNKIIVLNNVQDPGNLGTIIRSADTFAVDAVFLTKGCCDLYNTKTLRSTMSSVFNIPIIESYASSDLIAKFASNNIKIITTSLNEKSIDLPTLSLDEPYAVIIGNEGNGVENEWIENADVLVKIPMFGKSESLNVAVASAIMLYHLSCINS